MRRGPGTGHSALPRKTRLSCVRGAQAMRQLSFGLPWIQIQSLRVQGKDASPSLFCIPLMVQTYGVFKASHLGGAGHPSQSQVSGLPVMYPQRLRYKVTV